MVAKEKQQMESDWERVRREKKKMEVIRRKIRACRGNNRRGVGRVGNSWRLTHSPTLNLC